MAKTYMLVVTYPGKDNQENQILLAHSNRAVSSTDMGTIVARGEELLSANLIGSYMVVVNVLVVQ